MVDIHNLIIPAVILAMPLFLHSYRFLVANAIEEEKAPVIGAIAMVSLIISIVTKLFFLEKAPSFFEEIGGVIISFCLVFIILTILLFLFVSYVKVMYRALSS